MLKYEKNDIFTSLLFLPLVNCALERLLPLIVPTLILGDSTIGFPTSPTRLVISTSCTYILVFMLLGEILGPVGTKILVLWSTRVVLIRGAFQHGPDKVGSH